MKTVEIYGASDDLILIVLGLIGVVNLLFSRPASELDKELAKIDAELDERG